MHFYTYKSIFETHLLKMSMRYLSAICLSAAICFGSATAANAQGDSDPGLGSVGAMRPMSDLRITDEEFENDKLHFSIGNGFSKGEDGTRLILPQAEMRIPVQMYGYFDVKVPFRIARGELANVWNVGDVFMTYTHVIRPEYIQDWTYQITGGARIALSTADQQDIKMRSLPMVYQNGLGTTDLIVGAHAKFRQFLVMSVGYQQPIFQYNENGYDRRALNNDLIYSAEGYTIARKLYRYGDAMARIEGIWSGKRAGISVSAQGLYHVHNDVYTDRYGRNLEIDGSAGFTMNGVGSAFIRFGRYAQFKLDVTGSYPVIQRDVAPDGLRQDWYVMPRFSYFFGQRTLLW